MDSLASSSQTAPGQAVPLLFTHYGEEWIRGSETLLLDLLRYVDRSQFTPVIWCNGKEMHKAVVEAGYPAYRSEFEYYGMQGSPPFNLRNYKRLVSEGIQIVRKHGIRLIHSNSGAPTQWLLPVARGEQLPLVTHLHIDYQLRSRYLLGLHQATRIVGVSADVVADFRDDGVPEERLAVIYNGIDECRLKPQTNSDMRERLGIRRDAVVVGTVGSLIPRKGHDILIRAFGIVAHQIPEGILLITSDGPERKKLEHLAGEMGIRDRIRFLGYVDDIAALYRDCFNILALASRADAFGLVIAEAGLFGIPTVATSVGGIPEVIDNGNTGLLVPPENPEAFAAALVRLIESPETRSRFGASARERAHLRFTASSMARQFETTYASLLAVPKSELGWLGGGCGPAPYFRLARHLLRKRDA
jgi:glycosyltransferase involved in cell wall biosynthesis